MDLSTKISNLPNSPGCYLFKNVKGNVIYVGKAKNLRKRVSSYFQKREQDPKTSLLIKNISNLDIIVTKTEVEALLLENNLIKKFYPPYNLDLKDSRRYAYLRLTIDEDYPYLEVARKKDSKGLYYGPFVSGRIRKLVYDVITRKFNILTKKPTKKRIQLIDRAAYLRNVKKAKKILRGETKELIEELSKEMEKASKSHNFEHAIKLRDQTRALTFLNEKQHVELSRLYTAHIINYIVLQNRVYVLVFSLYKGTLENKQEFKFDYKEGFFEEFLSRFYEVNEIPKEIILPIKVTPAFSAYLKRSTKKSVRVVTPSKGEKKELLELALANVKATFFGEWGRVLDLQLALSLQCLPKIIECFDISHLRGTNTVASMVQFVNGKPLKSEYRKFRIREETFGDDYAAMQEVVRRRYTRLKRENSPMPDLIMVDGGIPQLNGAKQVLEELSIKIPLISLAKRFEEIYTTKSNVPIKLDKKRKARLLLESIRDEAHRFAIQYNRKLRSKEIKG